jgi:hypothetical protein
MTEFPTVKLGSTQITCTTTVRDTYPRQSDQKPPLGTLDWVIDNVIVFSCEVSAVSDSASRCQLPLVLKPTTANSVIGVHTLEARYGRELRSNHLTNFSSLELTYTENLKFAVQCSNDLWPGWTTMGRLGLVEVGHPLRCGVTLTDGGSGTSLPLGNTPVTWSTDNGSGNAGLGMFTCSSYDPVAGTTFLDIWTQNAAWECPAPEMPPSGPASIVCDTDLNGQCSVIYRRLYLRGAAIGTNQLTLSASSTTYRTPPARPIEVRAPVHQHPTGVTAVCASPDPAFIPTSDLPVTFGIGGDLSRPGSAQFLSTPSIYIVGGRARWFTCTATVADIDPSPAQCGRPPTMCDNPDIDDAYPPKGAVSFSLNGIPIAGCTLARVDYVTSPPPAQALGQAPFMSRCSPQNTFDLNRLPPPPFNLTIDYNLSGTDDPGHLGSSLEIPVTFN